VKVTKVPWVYTYVEKVGSNLDIGFACSCVFQDLGGLGNVMGVRWGVSKSCYWSVS
jgi:hypothetical protein